MTLSWYHPSDIEYSKWVGVLAKNIIACSGYTVQLICLGRIDYTLALLKFKCLFFYLDQKFHFLKIFIFYNYEEVVILKRW